MLRAFSDDRYDYYALTRSLGFNNSGYGIKDYVLPKGSVFVHDKNDSKLGSIGEGCLKLCWTQDGNTYGGLCGETVIFHAIFKDTDLFKLVQSAKPVDDIEKLKNTIENLKFELKKAEKELNNMLNK